MFMGIITFGCKRGMRWIFEYVGELVGAQGLTSFFYKLLLTYASNQGQHFNSMPFA